MYGAGARLRPFPLRLCIHSVFLLYPGPRSNFERGSTRVAPVATESWKRTDSAAHLHSFAAPAGLDSSESLSLPATGLECHAAYLGPAGRYNAGSGGVRAIPILYIPSNKCSIIFGRAERTARLSGAVTSLSSMSRIGWLQAATLRPGRLCHADGKAAIVAGRAKAHTVADARLPSGMHPPPPLPVPHIVPTDVDVDRMPATRQDAANNAEGSLVSDDGDESAWEALDAISDHRTEPTSSSDVRPARILSQEAKVETSRRDLAWDWRLRASSRSRPDYFAAPTSAVPSAKRRRPDLNVGFDKASASVGPESVPVDPLRHAADSYVTRWTRLVEEERDYQELAARKIFLERRRRGEVGVQVEAKTLVGLAVAGYHQQTESEFGTTSKAAFLRLESATGNELSPCEFRCAKPSRLARREVSDFLKLLSASEITSCFPAMTLGRDLTIFHPTLRSSRPRSPRFADIM